MGGLKALEKINNLIKASAESQGGDEAAVENGLTDEQAQTIERMIIEGIRNIKNKQPNTGTRKASIPRRSEPQKNPKSVIIPKASSNKAVETSKILRQKVQNTISKIHDNNPVTLKAILRSSNDQNKPKAANEKSKITAQNSEQRKINLKRLPNVGGGLAGTGNEP